LKRKRSARTIVERHETLPSSFEKRVQAAQAKKQTVHFEVEKKKETGRGGARKKSLKKLM